MKWSVQNLPAANQNFSIINQGGDFAFVNASGNQLLEINSDGNDNIKPLIDSACSFSAINITDTSSVYAYAGSNQIRCYSGNGTFLHAIALQGVSISGIHFFDADETQYLLVNDSINNQIQILTLNLEQLATWRPTAINLCTITDLLGPENLVGICPSPDATLSCTKLK